MKLLIIGASGLVGSNLMRVAQRAGHTVVGTYNSYPIPGMHPLSIQNVPAFEELFEREDPDAVICSAAWVWADGCQRNPQRALSLNRDYPTCLAETTYRKGSQFAFISTNYVFDGENGPYTEEDRPNPINVYGKSKLAGEYEILRVTRRDALIIRTGGIYGLEHQEKNFLYQVVRNLRSGRIMKVPTDQFGNATHAEDLSEGIVKLLERSLGGIWNLAGPDPYLCRKDFAFRIAREYGLDSSLLEPVPTSMIGQLAPRPRQAGLLIDKARSAIGFAPRVWSKVDLIIDATHLPPSH